MTTADVLLAAYMAWRGSTAPATGPTWQLRKHLRADHPRSCPGPIRVWLDSHSGPLSDLTPDPETVVSASVSCPHCPPGVVFTVSHRALDDMPELLADLADWEREHGPMWIPRVELAG